MLYNVRLDKFPTHLPYTKNKKAPDKFVKINNQSIYNGKLNRFSRNNVIGELHRYICKRIPKDIKIKQYPISVTFDIHTVINHGSVRKLGENIIWKYPSEEYVATWDIENLATIWIKAGMDSLVKSKVIPDDNVNFINSITYRYYPIEDFEHRYINITIDDNTG